VTDAVGFWPRALAQFVFEGAVRVPCSVVPYSVVYDLRSDKISALRIYFPMSLLIEQLTS
jgi:hypothetical protein